MTSTDWVEFPGGRAKFFRLLFLLIIFTTLRAAAAEIPTRRPLNPAQKAADPRTDTLTCGTVTLTSAEVLAGRYPDPEALNAPEPCKARAREMVEKWRQEDLRDWQTLADQACSLIGESAERWMLDKELKKIERESQMFDLRCACYSEILSQSTNAPAPIAALRIVTETGVIAQKTATVPVRLSHEVATKRTVRAMSYNAGEIMTTLSGKPAAGPDAKLFESEVTGQWNNEYKSALQSLFGDAARIEALSIELDQIENGRSTRVSQTTPVDLPQAKLEEDIRLLSVAYDGVVRDQELPRGQCYELLAIRHQLLLNSIAGLISKTPQTPAK